MDFDLIIIGSGPAGHTAAMEAVKHGLKTAIIEKDRVKIGGVCLNEGCIPLKGFLHASHTLKDYRSIKKTVLEKVDSIRLGLKTKLEGKGISLITGTASFVSPDTVQVVTETENKKYTAKYFLITVGAVPKRLFDKPNVLNPAKIFTLEAAPASALIIGGGVIGCEYASFLNNIGVEITICEIADSLLFGENEEAVRTLEREFKKKKIKILEKTSVVEINSDGKVIFENAQGTSTGNFAMIFEATGRVPATAGLNLEAAGVKTNTKGFIEVSEGMKTSTSNIYAAGDCLTTPQLAYTAAKEGELAVRHILGEKAPAPDYINMPKLVFSFPQLGSVGLSEAQAVKATDTLKIYKYFFKAIGKAVVENNEAGFLKLFVDLKKDELLGAVAVGGELTDMMNELAVIIKNKIKISAVKETMHIHPSYSEIIIEALTWGA